MSEETTKKDGSTGDNGPKAIVEKQKRSPVSVNPNPPKKPRTGCWGDPDVIVVVGGQEFQEHSSHLCSWSGYFHAALTREWKESKTKRFEFPHRNPEEWEILTSILAQFATTKISEDNYCIVLSWCDELIIPNAMAECDRFLVEFLNPCFTCRRKTTEELLDVLKVTLEPNNSLPLARAECIHLIACRADIWNDDELETILKFAEEHEDCGEKFRGVLGDVLPYLYVHFPSAQQRKVSMEKKFCRVCLVLPITFREKMDQVAAIIEDFSRRKSVSTLLDYLEAKEVPLSFHPSEKEWWQ